jgi:small-conductance mechanosensitive channel
MALLAAPGYAAGPSLPEQKAAAGNVAAPPSLDERAAAVRERLAQVQSRLAALPADESGAPPEAGTGEWAEYLRLLNMLGSAYQNHLDSLNKLKELRQSRQDLLGKAAAWQGFAKPGPYPVDFVDDLWNQVRAKEREIHALGVEQALFETLLEGQRAALEKSAQALRKAGEQLESADPGRVNRARWLRDLSELRNLHDEARVAAHDTERELRVESLTFLRDERQFAQRQAVAASRISPLSAAERDAKLALLGQAQKELEAEALQAAEADRTLRERMQEARNRLREVRELPNPTSPEAKEVLARDIGRLQGELDAGKAEAEASGNKIKILRLLNQSQVMRRQIWDLRYQIEHGEDPAALHDAAGQLQQHAALFASWREYLASELGAARQRGDEQEKRLAAWRPEYGERELGERLRRAYAESESVLRRAVSEADDLDALLRGPLEFARLREDDATLAERWRGVHALIGKWAGRVWDFELLTVEDRIVAEGREIVGTRRVTVGKVLQVLLILGVGLWLTVRIAECGRRLVARRLPGRENAVLLGLRLFTLLAVAGLVAFALFTVHIPLTVFTFLGGALAIGVGFGAQNILNNFISGLILLAESPIKLGDIVEVDGVRGRVSQIGSRCCQVRRFDGIDMLIPNSSFLEKNVTNWTLSDQHLRCTLTVGIAYGSPVGDAASLIGSAAAGHPRVLQDPAPEVYLEEFGDNALILRLDFWVDLVVEPNYRRVASDIRHRIQEWFDARGIAIAFPQRDIHLDAPNPVRVEIVAADPSRRT